MTHAGTPGAQKRANVVPVYKIETSPIGLVWIGLDWPGVDWILGGLNLDCHHIQLKWIELVSDWFELNWIGLELNGLDLEWIGFGFVSDFDIRHSDLLVRPFSNQL